MEIARDEVRVMTVHGAKGLEAPIVILADTMTQPSGPRPPRLLAASRRRRDLGGTQGRRRAARSRRPARRRRAEAEDEYRRLLYVAMTRAADRLIVCGADGERGRPKGCWYDLVASRLQPFLVAEDEMRRKGLALPQADARRRRRAPRRRPGSSGEGRSARTSAVAVAAGSRRSAAPGVAVAFLGVRGGDRPRFCARGQPPPPSAARRWRGGASSIG